MKSLIFISVILALSIDGIYPKEVNICELPKDPGNCPNALMQYSRFYYDAASKTCKSFKVGCKGEGKTNNFLTTELCQEKCIKKDYKDVKPTIKIDDKSIKPNNQSSSQRNESCLMEKKPGLCKAIIEKYYFDKDAEKCMKFNYTGCGGNKNNFITKKECEHTCEHKSPVKEKEKEQEARCKLEKESGKCKAKLPKFYYNSKTKKCEEFTYTGCGGNENKFETKEECNKHCDHGDKHGHKHDDNHKEKGKCGLAKESGSCKANFGRFYYDPKTKSCESFNYTGCGGNENRFESKEECNKECGNNTHHHHHKVDKCALEKETGPCKAAFKRFYYDPKTKKCENFTYGGCQGNENRFETLEDCNKECPNKNHHKDHKDHKDSKDHKDHKDDKESKIDVCMLDKEVGRCKASIPNFYYNSDTKKCEEFKYGGCEGNGNRFETKEECNKACPKKTHDHKDKDSKDKKDSKDTKDIKPAQDKCKLEKQTGLCRAHIPKFYYDSKTKKCEEFFYGGCGGNENRFDTLAQCKKECVK